MGVIESYVEPVTLYRYRSLKHFDRELKAIEHSYLHCSPFFDLNDPMEGAFTSSRRLRKTPEYEMLREAVIDKKDGLRICSFSEVPNHELMWAHYADQFKGICVSYSLSKLKQNTNDNVSFVRMFYNEKQPTIHNANRDSDHLAKMVLSYKNYRWLYEREWRMFATQDRVGYDDVKCVRSVQIGARVPVKLRNTISQKLSGFGIPVTCMEIRSYGMRFDPVE